MSFKLPLAPNPDIVESLETILDFMSIDGMVLNTSSGNEGIVRLAHSREFLLLTYFGQPIDSHPALLKKSVPAMNVVGAVDNDGRIWPKSNTAKYVNIYAPGVDLHLVGRDGRDNNEGSGYSGTSYCKVNTSVRLRFSTNDYCFKPALGSLQSRLIYIAK